eukprot:gene2307-2761_t
MSPERIGGDPYSFASDIWGFGLSLLACALGEYPYRTDQGYWSILSAIVNDAVPIPPPAAPVLSGSASYHSDTNVVLTANSISDVNKSTHVIKSEKETDSLTAIGEKQTLPEALLTSTEVQSQGTTRSGTAPISQDQTLLLSSAPPPTDAPSTMNHMRLCPSPALFDFLSQTTEKEARKRPTAAQLLRHPFLSHINDKYRQPTVGSRSQETTPSGYRNGHSGHTSAGTIVEQDNNGV